MSLNLYFDHIYCINLDEATERWDHCLTQFEKHNFIAERFKAIKVGEGKNGLLKGEIGCMLSHLGVIKDAKTKGYKKILVLEDDFELVDNFNQLFEEKYKNIPEDWELLYFGGNHVGGLIKINDDCAKTIHTFTTNSYAIKEEMFDVILVATERLNKQIDVYYADLQKVFNSYVFRPHLAFQKSGYSYIQEGDVNYTFLK